MNDGGPAFPFMCQGPGFYCGMTLRDYFAAKAPMPNAAEASDVLGWDCIENTPMPANRDDLEAMDKWRKLPRFEEKWKTISNAARTAACARFQYGYADAMLAEHARPSPLNP